MCQKIFANKIKANTKTIFEKMAKIIAPQSLQVKYN